MIERMTLPSPALPPRERTRTGTALAIGALAAGLVALLTSIVSVRYAFGGPLVAAFVGIVAVLLAITAISAKQRPLGAAVVGLVAGALALLLSLGVAWGAQFTRPGSPGQAQAPERAPSDDSEGSDRARGGITAAWPDRMATGGVVFGADLMPLDTGVRSSGEAPIPFASHRGTDPVDIILYVDYRCPHCQSFERTHADTLAAIVSNGEATLEIKPLTFLDSVSEGSDYSSRAAGLLACAADEQPESAWSIHEMLLNPNIQPPAPGVGHDDVFLLAAADYALGGSGDPSSSDSPLNARLQRCVAESRFVPFVQELNAWTFSNPVPGADPELRVEGTPLAVVAGKPFLGAPTDRAAFREFLLSQGIQLGVGQ